jgi:hypothetical protein
LLGKLRRCSFVGSLHSDVAAQQGLSAQAEQNFDFPIARALPELCSPATLTDRKSKFHVHDEELGSLSGCSSAKSARTGLCSSVLGVDSKVIVRITAGTR